MSPTIQHLFNRAIIIKRLKADGAGKRRLTSTGTVDAHLRRLDQRRDSGTVDVYGATHKAYVDVSTDVKEGDEVIDPDGLRYSVVGVIQKEPGIAINEHAEIILRQYTS